MVRRRHPSRKQPRDASGRFSRSPSSSSVPPSTRGCSPSSATRRSGRLALEARFEIDLDHAVDIEVPVKPTGFRPSYHRGAPLNKGRFGYVVTAEASESRKNKKKSRHLYTDAWPNSDLDKEMGVDTPGLPNTLIETNGKKYDVCFPKIKCKMILNDGSDEEEYDGPTKSVRQIFRMAEDLRIAVKRKHQKGEFFTLESDEEADSV